MQVAVELGHDKDQVIAGMNDQATKDTLKKEVEAAMAKGVFGSKITFAKSAYAALKDADALLIVTEWNEFREPDFEKMKKLMKGNLILDGHNLAILDPVKLESDLDGIAGVVTNGLFARRGADVLLLGENQGVRTLRRK